MPPTSLGISLHLMYENCFLNSLGMKRLSFYYIAFTCVMPPFWFHKLSWGPFLSALFPPPHEDSVRENRLLRCCFLRVVTQLPLSYLLPAGQPALCHVSLQELCWSRDSAATAAAELVVFELVPNSHAAQIWLREPGVLQMWVSVALPHPFPLNVFFMLFLAWIYLYPSGFPQFLSICITIGMLKYTACMILKQRVSWLWSWTPICETINWLENNLELGRDSETIPCQGEFTKLAYRVPGTEKQSHVY